MNARIGPTLLAILVWLAFMNRIADAQGGDIQFSHSGRELLGQARSEARRLRHEYVGTEHLVLALTSQTEGIAATALRKQGVDLQQVRERIESIVRPGRAERSADDAIPYTSRTKAAFALARESAVALGQTEVGAEHLIIGILREAKSVGAQVLAHHGVSLDALVDEIRKMNGRAPGP